MRALVRNGGDQRGFALAGVAGLLVLALGVVAIANVTLSNHLVAETRAGMASSELMARARQTNNLGTVSAVHHVAGELEAYQAGQPLGVAAFGLRTTGGAGGVSANVTQGEGFLAGALRLTTQNGGGNDGGLGTGYTSLPVPAVVRTLFGGQATFVGRLLTGDFAEVVAWTDEISGVASALNDARRVQVYEFPVNAHAVSGSRLNVADAVIGGSLLAGRAELANGAVVTGSLAVAEGIALDGIATVGGREIGYVDDAASHQLTKRLEAGWFGDRTEREIAIFAPREEETVVILSDSAPDAEGIPQDFRRVTGRAPSELESWFLPAYQCRTRIHARMVAGGSGGIARADVELRARSESSPPLSWPTDDLVAAFALIPGGAPQHGLSLNEVVGARVGETRWVLRVDPVALATAGLLVNAESVFVEFRDVAGNLVGAGEHAVALRASAPDLGGLPAFSLVTPTRLHLDGDFNAAAKPVSLFAPEVRFGVEAAPDHVTVTGQRGTLTQNAPDPVNALRGPDGTPLAAAARTVTLSDITSPVAVPPVVIRGLLILVNDR